MTDRPPPSRSTALGRRLVPGTLLFALLLSVPLAVAGQVVAAVIFGVLPLLWLAWVTLRVHRVERLTRELRSDPGDPDGPGR